MFVACLWLQTTRCDSVLRHGASFSSAAHLQTGPAGRGRLQPAEIPTGAAAGVPGTHTPVQTRHFKKVLSTKKSSLLALNVSAATDDWWRRCLLYFPVSHDYWMKLNRHEQLQLWFPLMFCSSWSVLKRTLQHEGNTKTNHITSEVWRHHEWWLCGTKVLTVINKGHFSAHWWLFSPSLNLQISPLSVRKWWMTS